MPEQRRQGAAEADVPEHIVSWWIGLLEGAAEGSHPLFGNVLNAKLEGQTLVVSGSLPSEAGRRDLQRELRLVAKQRGLTVRNGTTVAAGETEEHGLLEQTLVAMYAQRLHAELALQQVKENPLLRSVRLRLLDPGSDGGPGAADAISRLHVAATYQNDLRQAVAEGQSILIATTDEADAFALRQLLDEDTRSLRVLVMPPVAAENAPRPAAATKGPRP